MSESTTGDHLEQSSGAESGGRVPDEVRQRLALAVDLDDVVAAGRLGRDLQPFFGTFKVGLELFSAAGPDAISVFTGLGLDVFYDAKLHDIPATVGRASRVLGALGARYVTVHAAGGAAMVRAGVEGLSEGAAAAGLPPPTVLAVSVLTSDADASEQLLRHRVAVSLEAGAGGIVCAVPDLPVVREVAPSALLVTPGIRPEGSPADDQQRVATPRAAIAAGADLLVIGRPITRVNDHIDAARALVSSLI